MYQMWKPIIGVLAGLMFGGVAPAAVAADPELVAGGPHAAIKRTSDELIAVITSGKAYFEADPDRFYNEIERVLDPVIDFEAFARGVMAVYYRKATPDQRKRFHDTFKTGLVRTYGKALLNFGDERIVVLPPDRPPRQPDRDSVTMEVHSTEGKIYPVVYSVARDAAGTWRMRNIVINGINIGLTYKNQFASAMRSPQNKGSIDAVIGSWSSSDIDVEPAADGDAAKGAGS